MITNTLRYLATFVLALAFLGSCSVRGDDGAIRPKVADKFGTIIDIEAEFVAKPNDYYSQSVVKEPFILKVLSVNGKVLQQPIEIQYFYSGKGPITSGKRYQFEAYETIYECGTVTNWDDYMDMLQSLKYEIRHRLVVKDPVKTTSRK